MIAFLADENIPLATVYALRSGGTDISSMSEIAPAALDTVVLEIARAQNRIILTFDRDFGELIYRRQLPPPPGVVLIRMVPVGPAEPASVVLRLLEHTEIVLPGHFTVVLRKKVRQRPLPNPPAA